MALTRIVRTAARLGNTRMAISYCCRAVYSTASKDMLFTKKHEWISMSDDIGTVGISNYAQESLGEVVYAQLPEVGTEVAAGDECAALESVKAASEVYCPVSGTITEKNAAVESSPALVNQACYGGGWLFRVRVARPAELGALLPPAAYAEYLRDHDQH